MYTRLPLVTSLNSRKNNLYFVFIFHKRLSKFKKCGDEESPFLRLSVANTFSWRSVSLLVPWPLLFPPTTSSHIPEGSDLGSASVRLVGSPWGMAQTGMTASWHWDKCWFQHTELLLAAWYACLPQQWEQLAGVAAVSLQAEFIETTRQHISNQKKKKKTQGSGGEPACHSNPT